MKRKLYTILSIIMTILISLTAVSSPVSALNSKSKPSKVKIKMVKASSKTAIKIKWKKVKNAKGYQIKIATNSSFTKGLKTVNITKNTKTFKNLKRGTMYYVKVRAYIKSGSAKKYDSWSKSKAVTTTGYWCDEGGTHHSIQDTTIIGWYKTEEEAIYVAKKYNSESNYKTSHFQVDRCDFCPLYSAQVW